MPYNILIATNFDVLKYIKKYLKYQYSVYLMLSRGQHQKTNQKSEVE